MSRLFYTLTLLSLLLLAAAPACGMMVRGEKTETINDPQQGITVTSYAYDAANNRDTKTVTGGAESGFWDYSYNNTNQLTSWEKRSAPAGTVLKSATLGYDSNGNRTSQTVAAGTTTSATTYQRDAQDRLIGVVVPASSGAANSGQKTFTYDYDYRTRRTGTHETTATTAKHTSIVFAGGLSLAEWEQNGTGLQPTGSQRPTVEYTRGPDMGGGVGGLLYSARAGSGTGGASCQSEIQPQQWSWRHRGAE